MLGHRKWADCVNLSSQHPHQTNMPDKFALAGVLRQHSLAHRRTGENTIAEVCRRLHHAPRVARGAHAPAFAGIGHEVVVSAVITPSAGKEPTLHALLVFSSIK